MNKRKRFKGKVVWVTGASSGLGEALTKAFYQEGAILAISARRRKELERVRDECIEEWNSLDVTDPPGKILVLPLDLSDPRSYKNIEKSLRKEFRELDLLVHNAGRTHRALTMDTSIKVYRDLFEVNFFGPLELTKMAIPFFSKNPKSRIVVISSVAAIFSGPMRSGYNAVKRALNGFYDALRAELWQNAIGVTIVILGAVRTKISVNAALGDGNSYGQMDPFLEKGMKPENAAEQILKAIERGQDEVVIAQWKFRWLVFRRRFFPNWAARAIRHTPDRKQ